MDNQRRSIVFMLIFGGVLVVVILIAIFLPRQTVPITDGTPTVTPIPTPENRLVYEDENVMVIKIRDKVYEAEVYDPIATEIYIREKAKLKADDELTIVLQENIVPPLDDADSYQEEINQNLDEFNQQEEDQFDPAEWGLNPEHSE